MDRDTIGRSPPTRPCHLNRPTRAWRQTPQTRGRSVTKHRSWPTGKNRRHPSLLLRPTSIAEGVDPTMDRMKDSSSEPPFNRTAAETECQELLARNHSMLLLSGVGRHAIQIIGAPFSTWTVVNGAVIRHDSIVRASDARVARTKRNLSPKGVSRDPTEPRQEKRLQSAVAAPGFDPLKRRVGASSRSHRTTRDQLPSRLCWVKRWDGSRTDSSLGPTVPSRRRPCRP